MISSFIFLNESSSQGFILYAFKNVKPIKIGMRINGLVQKTMLFTRIFQL